VPILALGVVVVAVDGPDDVVVVVGFYYLSLW
jgi:hypothetical protein